MGIGKIPISGVRAALAAFLWAAAGGALVHAGGTVVSRDLTQAELKNDLSTLQAKDKAWEALAEGAGRMGYSPTIRWWNPAWGSRSVWSRGGRSVTLEWRVFDLDNIGSPDSGAFFYVSDGAGVYRALVVAVNHDPRNAREYTVEGGPGNFRFVQAAPFWARMERALPVRCGSGCDAGSNGCVGSGMLVTGSFSWSAYLKCLFPAACGGCAMEQALGFLRQREGRSGKGFPSARLLSSPTSSARSRGRAGKGAVSRSPGV